MGKRAICHGKVKHRNMAAAQKALTKVGNHGLSLYKCRHCGRWHLGSDRSRAADRIEQVLREAEAQRAGERIYGAAYRGEPKQSS